MRRTAILTLALFLAGPALAQGDRLTGHGGPVMDIAVSQDGQVATASFDNSVGLWSGETPVWRDGHAAAVNAVLVDRGVIASAGDDFTVIVWDGATPQRHEGHRGKVSALALSPDGTTLASASWDGTIGLWPMDGGAPRFLEGHRAGVNDVLFGADGALYSASADGTIRAWDIATGDELRQIADHGFGVNRMVQGPGWIAYGAVDGGTRLISPVTGEELADYTADRRPILALAYDAGSGQLAIGDGEGFIMIVDTATGGVVHDVRAAARGPVWALAFSPDGRTLYSGGLDPDVHVWDMARLGEGSTPEAPDTPYLGDPALMTNGERQFKRKCSICHALTEGTARKAGPSLHAVFGRRAGTLGDYTYSERLANDTIVWTDETIDALFAEGPAHYIPGSKMPQQVIARPEDRADLIAYLRSATGETP